MPSLQGAQELRCSNELVSFQNFFCVSLLTFLFLLSHTKIILSSFKEK